TLDSTDNTKDGTYYISEDTVFIKALNDDGELDPSVLSYKSIYESEIDGTDPESIVFVFGTKSKDADMIVFLHKDFVGEDKDLYFGVVTDDPWKVGSDYVVSIDVQGEGEVEYVVADKDKWNKGDVVAFYFNSDDEIVIDDSVSAVTLTDFDYDDGYLTDTTNDDTVKVATNVVIYSLDDNDDLDDKVKRTDIDDYAKIVYIVDEDGVMAAAVVSGDATPAPTDPKDAKYSLSSTTNKNKIVVAGAVYDAKKAENNDYTIKVTNLDDNTVAYYTDSIASGENTLTFNISSDLATGTYRIELFRDDPSKILAAFEKFFK
ncbi:MAG: hypothetical protein ACOX7R_04040, partial [Acetivibrionales bacterium]